MEDQNAFREMILWGNRGNMDKDSKGQKKWRTSGGLFPAVEERSLE